MILANLGLCCIAIGVLMLGLSLVGWFADSELGTKLLDKLFPMDTDKK